MGHWPDDGEENEKQQLKKKTMPSAVGSAEVPVIERRTLNSC